MESMHIHPTAQIDPQARVSEWVIIEEGCHVGPQVVIGPESRLGAGTRITGEVKTGRGFRTGKNVTIVGPWQIGDEVKIFSGAVLGVVVAQTSLLDCGTIGQKSRIGAGAQVLGKLAIGESAWVKPGSRLEGDLPTHGAATGSPAAIEFWRCSCGIPFKMVTFSSGLVVCTCPSCSLEYHLSMPEHKKSHHFLLPNGQYGDEAPAWQFGVEMEEG